MSSDPNFNKTSRLVRSTSGRTPLIGRLLVKKHILLDLPAADLTQVCSRLVEHLMDSGVIPAEQAADLGKALLAREQLASTAIGLGVACPHAYVDYLQRPMIVMARLKKPLRLETPDGIPTDLVFLLVGCKGKEREHLETLMQLARLLQVEDFRREIHEAKSEDQVIDAVVLQELRLAKGEAGGSPLSKQGIETRSGRLAGGLIADIRRRLPLYWDDFQQGFQLRSFSATIFLFFACFTGAVTFGALTAAETGGAIGTFEMILATAVCGVIYALTSGQPLVLLGGTGPILIFTAVLYRLCQPAQLDLPFLPVYGWVGLWSALFTIILAVTDASVVLRYVTRFTDEIFVLLMAAIFIEEAVYKLVEEFQTPHAGGYAAALSSVVLAIGTFGIAVILRQLRKGIYLRAWARNFLADFGTVIAIFAMTVLALKMRETTDLSHIEVPASFSLRLVDFTALPAWAIFASIIPAAFLTILVFLTQQLTGRVVNSPEFHLRKGPGYHLDLLVIGGQLVFCSLLGLPWLVAATVRSLNHVSALSWTHVEDLPSGTTVLTDRVMENRVTGVAIHLLIGAALFFVDVLHWVPMACLYGIFLYMGVVSFAGNQFWERVTLWAIDPALYPSSHYLRRMPTPVVHAFTGVQALCFAVLWLVKVSALAILFPLFLALLVPVRLALPRLFSLAHLDVLDAEERPTEESDREA